MNKPLQAFSALLSPVTEVQSDSTVCAHFCLSFQRRDWGCQFTHSEFISTCCSFLIHHGSFFKMSLVKKSVELFFFFFSPRNQVHLLLFWVAYECKHHVFAFWTKLVEQNKNFKDVRFGLRDTATGIFHCCVTDSIRMWWLIEKIMYGFIGDGPSSFRHRLGKTNSEQT